MLDVESFANHASVPNVARWSLTNGNSVFDGARVGDSHGRACPNAYPVAERVPRRSSEESTHRGREKLKNHDVFPSTCAPDSSSIINTRVCKSRMNIKDPMHFNQQKTLIPRVSRRRKYCDTTECGDVYPNRGKGEGRDRETKKSGDDQAGRILIPQIKDTPVINPFLLGQRRLKG